VEEEEEEVLVAVRGGPSRRVSAQASSVLTAGRFVSTARRTTLTL
jgi:hypothetical protein